VEYQEANNYILVKVEGELNLFTIKEMAANVAQLAKTHTCFSVLNDLRDARPTKGALDIFNMPKTAKNAGVDITFKRALVVGDKAEDFHFLETVFINQGHQVKMFTDLQAAKEWLIGP